MGEPRNVIPNVPLLPLLELAFLPDRSCMAMLLPLGFTGSVNIMETGWPLFFGGMMG